jgi:membrane protease YdiL (CAAX protease family)
MSTARLAAEAIVLYAGLPLIFDRVLTRGYRGLLLPGLWILASVAALVLHADPTFDSSRIWAIRIDPGYARLLAVRTVVGVGVVGALSRRFAPGAWLALPRSRPTLWVLLVLLYPVLSVLPQSVFWRVFFVHRYEPLFGQGAAMIAASTLAFAFAHVVFRNAIAVALTALGGLLFVHTYLATGSMLVSGLEHAVYGVAAFSFGIGQSLRLGSARARAVRRPTEVKGGAAREGRARRR